MLTLTPTGDKTLYNYYTNMGYHLRGSGIEYYKKNIFSESNKQHNAH